MSDRDPRADVTEIDAETMAAFVEGSLTEPERQEVLRALSRDAALRRDHQELLALLEADAPHEEATPGEEKETRPASGPSPGSRRSRFAVLIGLAAVVLVAVSLLLRGNPPQGERSIVVGQPAVVLIARAATFLEESGRRPLEVGQRLDTGDRLEVEAEGSVAALSSGVLLRNEELATDGEGVAPGPGSAPAVAAFVASLEDREARIEEIEAGRKRDQPPPGSPRGIRPMLPAGEVVRLQPPFTWDPGDSGSELVVVLESDGREDFRVEVPAGTRELAYPSGERPLIPGRQYRWRVMEKSALVAPSERSFYVWQDAEREALSALSADLLEFTRDETARDLLLVSYLREQNLIGAAIELVEELRDRLPGNRFLDGEMSFCQELLDVQ